MKVKVIGTQNVKFNIEDKEITGQKLFYTYETPNINGNGTGSVFERDGKRELNEEIEVRWSTMYKKFYVKK